MDLIVKCTRSIFLLFILVVNVSSIDREFGYCQRVVREWASSSLHHEVKEDKHTLKDLLFFLHIPRTGGRTYFHCLLRKLYSSSLECPRSYDKLRFDPRKQSCRLLVTHDDYSLVSKLPKDKTSVVTILRNPLDRVFSTYEFSIEVAARFLIHPNLSSAMMMSRRVRPRNGGVSTLDIWPWKYLVPWMREDLFARRDARRLRGNENVKSSDPYDMEEMAMPLLEYINHPVAHDIIHNGATFQIAGLTNNSYLTDAHEVRLCVQTYKVLGKHVIEVAKDEGSNSHGITLPMEIMFDLLTLQKRLDNMLYVGITEEHRESATLFGNVVGAQVISQLIASNSTIESSVSKPTEQSSFFADPELENSYHKNTTDDAKGSETVPSDSSESKEHLSVTELMEAYEVCISNLRKTQTRRRTSSLKNISPANFTKEARLQVPDSVLQQLKSLNKLDFELYEYAQYLFKKDHGQVAERLMATSWDGSFKYGGGGIRPSGAVFLAVPFLLVIFFCVYVNARRRISKVKI